MHHETNTYDRLARMMTQPVKKLILQLSAPTIIGMLVTAIYNMADTYFVSQISTSASGAVGIVFSLMALIQAIGFTLGMGAGNFISRLLGQEDAGQADVVSSTAFYTALAVGALMTVFGLIFLEPLVRVLGATETIMPHAKAYAQWILIGAPFMTASFVLNNVLRAQGKAFASMVGISIGGVLNVILDPIFIFAFGLGTAGAAIATIISQFIGFLILVGAMRRKDSAVGIRIANFTFRWKIHREILNTGMPSFYRQGLASLATVCMNLAAAPFGDAAIAAMSIVQRVFMFVNYTLVGFGQGFQPVAGFNYGAKRYDRVLEAFWFCVKVSVIVLTAVTVVFLIVSPQVIALFRRDDQTVIGIGTLALRLQALLFPLQGWVVMSNMLFQSTGKGMNASLIALGRQGLFFIPVVLILPRLFGVFGIQIAQPFADVLTFILAFVLAFRYLSVIRAQRDEQLAKEGGENESGLQDEQMAAGEFLEHSFEE
ncbi:MAG: MATE family efflux transporter [Christensenellales bacterium]